jgi:hypothetical protein
MSRSSRAESAIIHPAVLLDITYWHELIKPLPYEQIISDIHQNCNLLAQINVQKLDGCCMRLCSSQDQSPKPVVGVVISGETGCGWVHAYCTDIRGIIHDAWSAVGPDVFVKVTDTTVN